MFDRAGKLCVLSKTKTVRNKFVVQHISCASAGLKRETKTSCKLCSKEPRNRTNGRIFQVPAQKPLQTDHFLLCSEKRKNPFRCHGTRAHHRSRVEQSRPKSLHVDNAPVDPAKPKDIGAAQSVSSATEVHSGQEKNTHTQKKDQHVRISKNI